MPIDPAERIDIIMKPDKNKILIASGAVLGATAVFGTAAYLTTKFLMKTAIDREGPKMMTHATNRIAGSLISEEVFKRVADAAAKLEAAPTERVEIQGFDDITLVGHWYPAQNPKRIVVAMHGWRSSWSSDFGLMADFLHDNDCSVLFAEQRGQNNSGGDHMGFGVIERYDCLDWAQWVIDNKSKTLPVYLCGVSMGATTVLMAGGLKLPESVHGIIADCAFTSPDEIWNHVVNDNLHINYNIHKGLASAIYERKNQYAESSYSTIDALRQCKIPVLFIHGTDDHFVPIEMTYRNYLACASPKRLLIVPGADHGMSCVIDRAGYEAAVKNFWKEFD